jgi:hypothetical protein
MIGTTRIGGMRRRRRQPPELERHAGLASSQLAHLNRLEHDLQRACARYERAVAALNGEATELELRARTDAILDEVMLETGPWAGEVPGPIRLTDATFEDLRAVGLSLTQARRVIALRDEGVLDSTEHLDEVPGLPDVVVAELQHRLRD